MKKIIETNIFDEAIMQTKTNAVYSLLSPSRFTDQIWETYKELLKKSKEDKKAVNINRLMNIKGVRGAEWNHLVNVVRVRTDYGYKDYKLGRVTMETIAKRVEHFIQSHA